MLMKTGIFYFTTCFHGFGILRHVDPFVRMLHKLCLTLFYTLGLLYWVGLGNIQPTQILLYWVQQAEHRLHREVAGMIGLDCNHNYQSPA